MISGHGLLPESYQGVAFPVCPSLAVGVWIRGKSAVIKCALYGTGMQDGADTLPFDMHDGTAKQGDTTPGLFGDHMENEMGLDNPKGDASQGQFGAVEMEGSSPADNGGMDTGVPPTAVQDDAAQPSEISPGPKASLTSDGDQTPVSGNAADIPRTVAPKEVTKNDHDVQQGSDPACRTESVHDVPEDVAPAASSGKASQGTEDATDMTGIPDDETITNLVSSIQQHVKSVKV